MFEKKKPEGRIFISYRRSDAQGVAGRLSDTLEAYFGDNSKRAMVTLSEEAVVTFFGATLIVPLMFVLMNMSGFKMK